MKLSFLLPPLTLVLLGIAIANVVIYESRSPVVEMPALDISVNKPILPSIPAGNRSLLSGPQSLLIAGVSTRLPDADDYALVSEMPWEYRNVSRLFRDAGPEMSCDLLVPGLKIVQPLVQPRENLAGPLGRLSLFSIRLHPDENLGDGLPSVTRGIIADYLRSHQLTIQPTFYSDARQRLVMSPRLKAAFLRIDSPEQTISAEAMIATSIGELRTLGAMWDTEDQFDPALMRTMLLALRYSLDADPAAGRKEPRREYELVCLHLLPDSTASNPKLAVFATSDARTQFHLLEPCDVIMPAASASVIANIRFADAKMLGMYPESPIVTSVQHQALLSVPVDVVMAQLEGLGGATKEGGFPAVLDELYYKALGIDPPVVSQPEVDVQPSPPKTLESPKQSPGKSGKKKSGVSA